jgi:hypothetical protein
LTNPSLLSLCPSREYAFHTEMEEINKLTEKIIGSAIEVHRQLGPGLLEGTYEAALAIELESAGLHFDRQIIFPVLYKN